MVRDEYELMPGKRLSSMKKELEELRRHAKNIDPKTGLPKETNTSIENLNKSINSLLGLFQTATEELKLEERDEALISKQMTPLMKKIDTLLEQNEKIAKGIIAIADMVREKTERIEEKEEEISEGERRVEEKPEEVLPPKAPPGFPPPPIGAPPAGFPLPPGPTPPSAFPPPPTGAPEPMPPLGAPGPLPGLEEEKPKKKGFLGGLFKK